MPAKYEKLFRDCAVRMALDRLNDDRSLSPKCAAAQGIIPCMAPETQRILRVLPVAKQLELVKVRLLAQPS